MSKVNRRQFLNASAKTAAALGVSAATTRAALGANEKVRIAVAGIHGRGAGLIKGFTARKDVEVACICDPDTNLFGEVVKSTADRQGRAPRTETDVRRVLEDKSIDALVVATPDHWHAPATIWACQAGKDVYVEKPGSHNLYEGRKMIEAASKYKRIVQHGVQLRSSPAIQEAVEHLRNGLIGKVYMARGLVFRWRGSIGNHPDEAKPPSHLDWNLWQGPVTERAFSKRLVHYNWHWHWDYGNGDVGNQGIHETDLCQWGLDVQLPSRIVAMGGKFLWDDDKETPEVLTTNYYYPESNRMIQFEVRPWCTNAEAGATVGNIFYGSEGFLVVKNYGTYETYMGRKREPGPKRSVRGELDMHFGNFIKAVRARDTSLQHGPVETAHYSAGLAHLGNIAFRLGREVDFDPKKERFTSDADANAMLSRNYRAPFVVPEKV